MTQTIETIRTARLAHEVAITALEKRLPLFHSREEYVAWRATWRNLLRAHEAFRARATASRRHVRAEVKGLSRLTRRDPDPKFVALLETARTRRDAAWNECDAAKCRFGWLLTMRGESKVRAQACYLADRVAASAALPVAA